MADYNVSTQIHRSSDVDGCTSKTMTHNREEHKKNNTIGMTIRTPVLTKADKRN